MKEKCSFCNNEIDLTDSFARTVEKNSLKKKRTFTTGRKIKIYLLSFVIAPFGLYWFFKFFKMKILKKEKQPYTLFI
jgi:hypothetical protein